MRAVKRRFTCPHASLWSRFLTSLTMGAAELVTGLVAWMTAVNRTGGSEPVRRKLGIICRFFKGVLATRLGSLELKIGSLESAKIGSPKSEKSGPFMSIPGTFLTTPKFWAGYATGHKARKEHILKRQKPYHRCIECCYKSEGGLSQFSNFIMS